jgi:hypothetical protein
LISTFAVLAPQLADRESDWNQAENVEQIRRAISVVSGKKKLPTYIAFQGKKKAPGDSRRTHHLQGI